MATPLFQVGSEISQTREEKQAANRHPALEWAQISVAGARGGANEDAVLGQRGFFGVADGVGGGSCGEIASVVTLRHCAAAPKLSTIALATWVKEADGVVARSIAELSDRLGGATLVGLWLNGWRARLLHVGDARAFLFRRTWRGRWRLFWQTIDQTYANNHLPPPPGGSPDDPCQMIGTGAVGDPGKHDFSVQEDDLLLLCSDGLHSFVKPETVTRIIDGGVRADLPLDVLVRQLVAQAQQNGSYDDITMLLLRRKRSRWRFWVLVSVAAILAVFLAVLQRFGFSIG